MKKQQSFVEDGKQFMDSLIDRNKFANRLRRNLEIFFAFQIIVK